MPAPYPQPAEPELVLTMKTKRPAPLAVAPLLLVLAACGGQGQSARSDADTPTAGPVEAAASGIVEEVRSAAAGRPIPREGLPDYVETYANGRYLTSMTLNNDVRTGGMLMYAARASAADLVAFHRAAMERHGMTPGEATTRPVRDNVETSFEGRTADGRSSLTVIIIDKSEPDTIVQMNYADER